MLNVPANFLELFPANILPCLKYLVWKNFREDGYRGRVSPYPWKYSAMVDSSIDMCDVITFIITLVVPVE